MKSDSFLFSINVIYTMHLNLCSKLHMYRINQASSSIHDSVLQKSKNYSHVRWLTVLNGMGAHW